MEFRNLVPRNSNYLIHTGLAHLIGFFEKQDFAIVYETGYALFIAYFSFAKSPKLYTFLTHHKFPEGPLFLKPYKEWNDLLKRNGKHHFSRHKKEKIQHILNVFENKKFILIGDDSQHDGEIYSEIALKNPDRIKGIFIRKTGKSLRAGIKKLLAGDHDQNKTSLHIFNDPDILYDTIRLIN